MKSKTVYKPLFPLIAVMFAGCGWPMAPTDPCRIETAEGVVIRLPGNCETADPIEPDDFGVVAKDFNEEGS